MHISGPALIGMYFCLRICGCLSACAFVDFHIRGCPHFLLSFPSLVSPHSWVSRLFIQIYLQIYLPLWVSHIYPKFIPNLPLCGCPIFISHIYPIFTFVGVPNLFPNLFCWLNAYYPRFIPRFIILISRFIFRFVFFRFVRVGLKLKA